MEQQSVYLVGPERVELRRVPVPELGPGEIRVRIRAATTCGTDVKVFRRGGHPRMLEVPGPFGHEFAGTVEEVGEGVTRWAAGDAVVVANSASCGECAACEAGRENLCTDLHYLNGAFAESILVPRRFAERSTYPLPADLPFEIAALAEPLACVLHGVSMCELSGPCDMVLYGVGPIGLLFVGVLAARGHRVVAADTDRSRLEVARRLGAAETVPVEPGGGQAASVVERSPGGRGFAVSIDATGVPRVWEDAIASACPGGLVNLFGGCAPGTSIPLDTHHLHYGEITVKGVYHHRPATFAGALETLARSEFDAGLLLSAERPLPEVEDALRSMIRREALKVLVRPGGGPDS